MLPAKMPGSLVCEGLVTESWRTRAGGFFIVTEATTLEGRDLGNALAPSLGELEFQPVITGFAVSRMSREGGCSQSP